MCKSHIYVLVIWSNRFSFMLLLRYWPGNNFLVNIYRVAQKLWPKRSGLLWPYHLRNESKSFWNAFLSSAIRGFYQDNTKNLFIVCSFLFISVFFSNFWPIVIFNSYHSIFDISYSSDPEKWLRYQAESIWSWRGMMWSHDLIRQGTGSLDMHLAPWEPH